VVWWAGWRAPGEAPRDSVGCFGVIQQQLQANGGVMLKVDVAAVGLPSPGAAAPSVMRETLDLAGEVRNVPSSVLLVEVNIIILMDTEEMLRALGVAEVLTATDVAGAMEIIDKQLPAFAVLDFGLGDDTSLHIAVRLQDAGIPYCFVTGYEQEDLPARFANVPRVTKPYSMEILADVLADAWRPD
jgi:CheY-like chemotaxis protein